MFWRTFRGGAHPDTLKELTASSPIMPGLLPPKVVLPLKQHIGQPCIPVVQLGDKVKCGQIVGAAKARISAPIHASISGMVVEVGESVIIQSNNSEIEREYSGNKCNLDLLQPSTIREVARDAGLVGLGGATFPTSVKLDPPLDQPIDTLIVNGCECEPYLTADHRLMVEQSREIVFGLYAMAQAVGACRAIIAIEDNKPDAAKALALALREALLKPYGAIIANITAEVRVLPTKYPQGAEKQLIWAATGRTVPVGGLPSAVGVLVHNVGTAYALAEAITTGKPLIERVVTVAGPIIRNPGNYRIRLGTLVKDVLAFAGGVSEPISKLILGGPMMGVAQTTDEVPVTKGTSGILAFGEKDLPSLTASTCIRCGRCIEVCPISLQPLFLARLADKEYWQEAEGLGVMNCIECGSCAFSCPAKRPLVHQIRLAKAALTKGGITHARSTDNNVITAHA